MKLDAIIVGGSFAGLAVASRLQGNAILIEQREIGSRRVSSCATPLKVPQQLGCLDSVLQVYHKGFIHAPSRVVKYDLPYPFCTFDYQKFCQSLAQRLE